MRSVYLVTLELRVEKDPEPIAAVLSNPFGVFAFEPVLPCSAFTVTARHRFFTFGAPAQIEPKDFPPDGSGIELEIKRILKHQRFNNSLLNDDRRID